MIQFSDLTRRWPCRLFARRRQRKFIVCTVMAVGTIAVVTHCIPCRHLSDRHITVVSPPDALPHRPPAFDREMLLALEERWRREGGDDEAVWDRAPHPNSPPKVVRIPAGKHQPRQKRVSSAQADMDLCGASPCRLLLPGWIADKEERAERHFHQIAHLTQSLNRTLVLPNVQNSRMGTCYRYPFDFYYERHPFIELGIPTVSFEAFQTWVSARESPPTGQVASIESEKPFAAKAFVSFDHNSHHSRGTGKRKHCLSERSSRLNFSGFAPASIFPKHSEWHINSETSASYGDAIVASLKSLRSLELNPARVPISPLLSLEPPDVFVISWELHDAVFCLPTPASRVCPTGLPYSPDLTNLADLLSAHSHPYAAIHWPIESLDHGTSAFDCATRLVEALKADLSHPSKANIRTVYLATNSMSAQAPNYPSSGATTPSARNLSDTGHHRAITILRDAFKPGEELSEWRLTTLMEELAKTNPFTAEGVHYFDRIDLDPGAVGIVNELMVIRAESFIPGDPGCGMTRCVTTNWMERKSMY
ncbi:hypothetical protein BOTBODRAFT_560477 [Botryobasidium botryosum FD-172 SS1]|uniref:Uncharacterized protein n=1 Tax=Botryobasidium botryosum (strain FD-172 SS1) TaxID=930990 RepID=A0A067MAT2_BOTB1|nr:hypothetical protein BOTBODRAFT_560477 [Botryobasidium botryosum FD-172 SS1]